MDVVPANCKRGDVVVYTYIRQWSANALFTQWLLRSINMPKIKPITFEQLFNLLSDSIKRSQDRVKTS